VVKERALGWAGLPTARFGAKGLDPGAFFSWRKMHGRCSAALHFIDEEKSRNVHA
jgi:hypothetical protein